MKETIDFKRERLKRVWQDAPQEVKSLTFSNLGHSQQRVFYTINKSSSEKRLDDLSKAIGISLVSHISKCQSLISKLY